MLFQFWVQYQAVMAEAHPFLLLHLQWINALFSDGLQAPCQTDMDKVMDRDKDTDTLTEIKMQINLHKKNYAAC